MGRIALGGMGVDAARRYLEETFAQVRDRAERAGVAVEQAILEGDDPAAPAAS